MGNTAGKVVCEYCGSKHVETIGKITSSLYGGMIVKTLLDKTKCNVCGAIYISAEQEKDYNNRVLSKYKDIHNCDPLFYGEENVQ